jgi:hypothetical protein
MTRLFWKLGGSSLSTTAIKVIPPWFRSQRLILCENRVEHLRVKLSLQYKRFYETYHTPQYPLKESEKLQVIKCVCSSLESRNHTNHAVETLGILNTSKYLCQNHVNNIMTTLFLVCKEFFTHKFTISGESYAVTIKGQHDTTK